MLHEVFDLQEERREMINALPTSVENSKYFQNSDNPGKSDYLPAYHVMF
jgi:hypothetical protein